VTEIPEHLLKRSAERKAAMSGEAPAADAPAETSSAVAPVADAAPAVAAAATPAVPEPEPEPEVTAPYVEADEARKRMPFWIVPVLLTLPVWAAMYVGTLERVPQGLTGLAAVLARPSPMAKSTSRSRRSKTTWSGSPRDRPSPAPASSTPRPIRHANDG